MGLHHCQNMKHKNIYNWCPAVFVTSNLKQPFNQTVASSVSLYYLSKAKIFDAQKCKCQKWGTGSDKMKGDKQQYRCGKNLR